MSSTSDQNAELITKFYTAFQNLNGSEMANYYSPEATFRDEAFTLKGKEIGGMWKMLTKRAKEFSLTFSEVVGTETGGSAHWIATYLYGKNKVVNDIRATFVIENGKIVKHVDVFDFWKWSSQALGVPGSLFGWLPPFQNMVRSKAMKGLKEYMEKHPED